MSRGGSVLLGPGLEEEHYGPEGQRDQVEVRVGVKKDTGVGVGFAWDILFPAFKISVFRALGEEPFCPFVHLFFYNKGGSNLHLLAQSDGAHNTPVTSPSPQPSPAPPCAGGEAASQHFNQLCPLGIFSVPWLWVSEFP